MMELALFSFAKLSKMQNASFHGLNTMIEHSPEPISAREFRQPDCKRTLLVKFGESQTVCGIFCLSL